MMERRIQAMGPPIAAISPTMTMKTPSAGPMEVMSPTRRALLLISAGMPARILVRRAMHMNSMACRNAMPTVTAQSIQMTLEFAMSK